MKKIILFIMMLVGVVGCSCKKTETFKLDYETLPTQSESSTYLYNNYGLLSKELASTSQYDAKVSEGDNFLLFVYAQGCYGCSLLAPALKEYVEDTNLVVYTLDYSKVSDKHDLYKNGINTTPYLVIVSEGSIAYKELMKLSNDASANVDTVKLWMEEHIEWGNN